MVKTKKRDTAILILEYAAVFFLFMIMFYYYIPQSDVFLFARGADGSFPSVINSAVYYGNGRLLGNIFAMFFSCHFDYAPLFISTTFTLIIMAANKLVFNNNIYTAFIVMLFFIFPSANIIGECYYVFACYCNYIFPVLFVLVILIALKSQSQPNKITSFFVSIIVFIFGLSSCLFSENTTAVVITLSVLIVFYEFIKRKKIKIKSVAFLLSTICGTIIMFALPVLTKTSYKMDSYREMASGVSGIVYNVVSSYFKFAQTFTSFVLLAFLLSFALVLVVKNQKKGNRVIKGIQYSIFVGFPFVSFVLSYLYTGSLYISHINIVSGIIVMAYFIDIVLTVFLIDNKENKFEYILLLILTMSSVGPMMLVTQYGNRTYYTTLMIAYLFAVRMIKQYFPKDLFEKLDKRFIRRCTVFTTAAITTCVCAFMFVQTVYNYDFYVVRTNGIAQQISEEREVEIVPAVNTLISFEDEWPNIVADAFNLTYDKIKVVDSFSYEYLSDYTDVISGSLIASIKYANDNPQYRNPLYPETLVK